MPPTTPERGPDGKFVKSDAANEQSTDPKESQQAPVEKVEKPPKRTAEQDAEVSESLSIFAGDFVTGNKAERKKVDDKSKVEPKADDAKKDEEKAKTAAATTKTPVAKPAALTAESLASAVDKLVESKLKPAAKDENKPDEKPADPDAGLDDVEKRKLAVIRFMEKLQPDKYRGVADKYKSNLKKLSDYAADWEKKNPGQKFDDEAEEHTEFFDKNELFQPWDDEDYTDAKAEMIAEKKIAEASAESNKKLSALERHNKVLESRPLVDKHQTVAARAYWKSIGGEFDGVVTENGQIDQAKYKELLEKNPDFLKTTIESAQRLDTLVEQAYLLKKGLSDFDSNKPEHKYLAGFALSEERRLMSRPLEKQVNETGQQFKPAKEYFALPNDQRERFWTFNESDLAALLAADESKKMKAYIAQEEEKFNRWAKAKGLALKESVLKEKPDEQEEKPAADKIVEQIADLKEEAEEEKSPSSSASPKSATILDEGKAGQKSGLDTFASKMFG